MKTNCGQDRQQLIGAAVVSISMLVAGCVHANAYQRNDFPTGSDEGPPVSSYSIVDDSRASTAKGAVHVISLGSERLPVPEGQPEMYVHLRLAADNASDAVEWKLDPNQQLLIYAGQARQPTFAEASAGGPVLKVARGKRGYLDVYYPLPPEGNASKVVLAWRLIRGDKTVAKATAFSRIAGKDSAYVYYQPSQGHQVYTGLGLDTWWWSDYYFWHHGGLWWPCRQSYVHHHYPRYRPHYVSSYAGGGGSERGGYGPPSSHSDTTSSWRGGDYGGGSSSSDSGKSSWRGSSSDTSSSSSSVSSSSDSGSSSSGGGSSSSSGGGSSSSGGGSSSSGGGSSSSSGGGSSSSSGGGSSGGGSGSGGGSSGGGGEKSGWRGGGGN